MRLSILVAFLFITPFIVFAQQDPDEKEPDVIATETGDLTVTPISHATFALQINDYTIYFDPTGGAEAFEGIEKPDLILVTDIHGDHLNAETIEAVKMPKTKIIAPQAVADELGEAFEDQLVVFKNGDTDTVKKVLVTAIPMYNLPETEDSRHPKGRGNGYVLEIGGKRIYVSGDTEDIPEMRNLEKIDVAFICMNLPYTMTVDQAAKAVLDFKPRVVYPYHFRGKDGFADVEQFKQLVTSQNEDIKVLIKEWYPNKE